MLIFFLIGYTYHQRNTCNKAGAEAAIERYLQFRMKYANRTNSISAIVKKYHRLVPAIARCLTPTYSTIKTNIAMDELPVKKWIVFL